MIKTYTQKKGIKIQVKKSYGYFFNYGVAFITAGVFTGSMTKSSLKGLLVTSGIITLGLLVYLSIFMFHLYNNTKIEIDTYCIIISRLLRSPKEISFTEIVKITMESDNITQRTGTAFQRMIIETHDGKHDHLVSWFDRYALMCELSRKSLTNGFEYETKNYDPTTELD